MKRLENLDSKSLRREFDSNPELWFFLLPYGIKRRIRVKQDYCGERYSYPSSGQFEKEVDALFPKGEKTKKGDTIYIIDENKNLIPITA
ncbi:hypothetical protein GF380_04235 [Candidatus Uhrbacteria bacterium]|nr:hypothetical protein [Candidatus Uhrbacteria bacterium]